MTTKKKTEIQLTELDSEILKLLKRRSGKPTSYKDINQATGISVRSVVRCVNRCIEAGAVKRKAGKDQGPNVYTVTL